MRRWLRVLLAFLGGLLVLMLLNAVVTDHQTKSAEVTIDGAKIVSLPGGDLQVLDEGPRDAPPIVLLHCYTCSINWWEHLIPLLDRDHRVIAIDLLGHGGSEKPRSGYSIEDQAQLVAGVLGRLGVRNAIVVGHSLGGAVAVALAEQSPELVAGVTIIDTEPDTSYGSLDLLARAVYVPVLGEGLWRVKNSWTIRKGLEQAFAPGHDVPDQYVDDVKRMTYTSYDHSHSAFDSYVDESALDDRLRRLDLPLLVVFGAEDQIVDAREALSAYADVPGAETALVQGSGHSPNVEKPLQTARLIDRFARGAPRNAAPKPSSAHSVGPAITARCGTAIIGPGKPNWRRFSAVVGPFGLSGPGRDFSKATRIGSALVTKIFALVEGHKPVILRVPATEQGQVGLIYGSIHFVRAVGQAARQVTFEPCPQKPRTAWPGGLALTNRQRITLDVVVGGSVKKLRIG
jgi:pimeloyl-ACP methyl ester carboxylesterase